MLQIHYVSIDIKWLCFGSESKMKVKLRNKVSNINWFIGGDFEFSVKVAIRLSYAAHCKFYKKFKQNKWKATVIVHNYCCNRMRKTFHSKFCISPWQWSMYNSLRFVVVIVIVVVDILVVWQSLLAFTRMAQAALTNTIRSTIKCTQ